MADVVASLGLPNRTYDVDGRRLLQYEFAHSSSTTAIFSIISLGFGGQNTALHGAHRPNDLWC